jgi:hypothetical protein
MYGGFLGRRVSLTFVYTRVKASAISSSSQAPSDTRHFEAASWCKVVFAVLLATVTFAEVIIVVQANVEDQR